MKWSIFLALVLVGLVAGHAAWKENYEYRYKLVEKTFVKSRGQEERGTIASVRLALYPMGDALIGEIKEASFDSDLETNRLDATLGRRTRFNNQNDRDRSFEEQREMSSERQRLRDRQHPVVPDYTNRLYLEATIGDALMGENNYASFEQDSGSKRLDTTLGGRTRLDTRSYRSYEEQTGTSSERQRFDSRNYKQYNRLSEMAGASSSERNQGTKTVLQRDVPLNKKFKIIFKNGVIDSLAVDRTMTANQKNQVRYIASQLQIDTNGKNVIDTIAYNLPDRTSSDAYFTAMEPTVFGVCKTNYDISRLPEYLAYPKYETIPSLHEFANGEDVIQVKKATKYDTCNARSQYLSVVANNAKNDDLNASLDTDIIISGNLDDYTIHSSVSTNKVGDVNEFVYLTLESIQRKDSRSNYNYDSDYNPRSGKTQDFENLQNIGNLVYDTRSL